MEHFTYSYKYRVLPGPCELVHQEPAPREQWVFHHLNLISTENTGTQPYQPGSLVWSHSAINGSIHVSQEWGMGSKCITSAKLRVPQTTHNTYTGLKKKKAKRQWDILLRKSFLLRLHTVNGWSPWPGFYHTLKSQSRQLGPLKKENNPLRIFLYENKNLSHSAISSKASYFTESSDFDPCIKFPVEAQSIFLCWINPHKYSLELKSKVSNGFL